MSVEIDNFLGSSVSRYSIHVRPYKVIHFGWTEVRGPPPQTISNNCNSHRFLLPRHGKHFIPTSWGQLLQIGIHLIQVG